MVVTAFDLISASFGVPTILSAASDTNATNLKAECGKQGFIYQSPVAANPHRLVHSTSGQIPLALPLVSKATVSRMWYGQSCFRKGAI